MAWKTVSLIDDHRGSTDPVRENHLIGMTVKDDGYTEMVSFGRVEYRGVICVNRIYHDEKGCHLSRCATYTLQRDQLAALKEHGVLVVSDWDRTRSFHLLPA